MPASVRRRFPARVLALLVLSASVLTVAPARSATTTPLVAAGEVPMTAEIVKVLTKRPAAAFYGLFVHFRSGTFDENKLMVEGHGLTITSEFPSVDVVHAWGTVGEIRGLTREPSVGYLEHNRKIQFFQDTTVWSTRVRAAHEEVMGGPYFDPSGNILDGNGVGIAVIDTGVDGSHPDLANRVVNNFKVICTTPFLINTTTEQCFGPVEFVDIGTLGPSDDNASGHGTHVSGIALGDGTASTGAYGDGAAPVVKGSISGVAPGAGLYGFSIASGSVFLTVAESFQWILDNNAALDPPIKVINNSWGTGPITGEPELPHDPNSIESKLVNQLVGSGVTVVFAAANRGGDGATDRTSPECKNPTPGVICVANYNDGGTGSRNNVLSDTSSRGSNGQPLTYPDISAPGTSAQQLSPILVANGVVAACRPGTVLADCAAASEDWPGFYSTLSGTSMASPHVAGAVALLAQGRPDLTPAQIEDVVQDTAHKFTAGGAYQADPQNAGGTTSFDKGAGLLDVKAALDGLGVPHAGTASTGTPQVNITAPLEGTTFDGSTPIVVEGTAADGTLTTPPPTQLLVDGDAGDFTGSGAADIVAVRARETPAGTTPGGFFYEVEVRDAFDLPTDVSMTMQLVQTVDGREAFTRITASVTSVNTVPGSTLVTAPATEASRDGNTFSFFVPYANLGNPSAGSAGYNLNVQTLVGTIVDAAPGVSATALADTEARPQYARPYTVARPDLVVPPVAQVMLSVDGGTAEPAVLAGSSPAYSFTASVDPDGLADGPHTLVATLMLDGIGAASDAVTIQVERPDLGTYEILITEPADGATVVRAPVNVAGTTFTDDPSLARQVTVELLGPEPLAEIAATGTDAWATQLDFDRQAGDYTIVARFSVDGVVQAVHQIGVVVPPPLVGEQVSCAPKTVSFWRHELGSSQDPDRFTALERGALLERAVQLSGGVFASAEVLRDAVLYAGKPVASASAQRQFATLLLNMAAGDLSAVMSKQVGLAGSEQLDPSVYATGVLGSTVDSAVAWVRSQFPDGNLGGAAEVASAINNGHGLIC